MAAVLCSTSGYTVAVTAARRSNDSDPFRWMQLTPGHVANPPACWEGLLGGPTTAALLGLRAHRLDQIQWLPRTCRTVYASFACMLGMIASSHL